MSIFKIKQNNKWITLTEAIVAVVVLTLVILWVVRTIQAGKTLKYVNRASQDISQLQDYVLWNLDVKNESFKKTLNSWDSDFAKNARDWFLTNFPGSQATLSAPNWKKCYSIKNTGWNLSYTSLDITSDKVVLPSDSFMNARAENTEDTEYSYSYATSICLTNAFEYIDATSSKNTSEWPVIAQITSSYQLANWGRQITMEKQIYFDEK